MGQVWAVWRQPVCLSHRACDWWLEQGSSEGSWCLTKINCKAQKHLAQLPAALLWNRKGKFHNFLNMAARLRDVFMSPRDHETGQTLSLFLKSFIYFSQNLHCKEPLFLFILKVTSSSICFIYNCYYFRWCVCMNSIYCSCSYTCCLASSLDWDQWWRKYSDPLL